MGIEAEAQGDDGRAKLLGNVFRLGHYASGHDVRVTVERLGHRVSEMRETERVGAK